jgi:hypothetical protein
MLIGQGYMSNELKAGRVSQIFGGQLWDRISIDQSHFHFFFTVVRFVPVLQFLLSEVIALC